MATTSNESTAQIGYLTFDASGTLTYAVFGSDCGTGCSVGAAGPLEWAMAFWTTTPLWYPYTNVNGVITAYEGAYGLPTSYAEEAHVFVGHVIPPAVVPEPESIPLVLGGMGMVAALGIRQSARPMRR